jgi:hypothetical protein
MLDMSPNELLESLKVLGFGATLEQIEEEIKKKRGEQNGKGKRGATKKGRTK